MLVGTMTAQIYMHGITSLKEKRSIIKSLIARLQNRFNVSVAEVDQQDSRSSAVIGIAVVSNESRFIEQQIESVLKFMRNDGRFYLGQVDREIFS